MKAKVSKYDNEDVKIVSEYLQYYMKKNNIVSLTADQCAVLLDGAKLVSKEGHPKQGYNFRQMLRDGRDGLINLVVGVSQVRPDTRWKINRMDG